VVRMGVAGGFALPPPTLQHIATRSYWREGNIVVDLYAY
jgi:hypothetical protein